jgi:hypothetical protein
MKGLSTPPHPPFHFIDFFTCLHLEQFGRPLYGDVFGVHQQDQPNYEVGLHKSSTLQLEG